jgi:hypothetical protein
LTNNYKSSGQILPPLKETNKFSSWAEKSLMEQAEEIINENELVQEKENKTKSNRKKHDVKSSNSSFLLSMSGSLDLDSYEIEDEVEKTIYSATSDKIKSNSPKCFDSLDLDNSDDLNKII